MALIEYLVCRAEVLAIMGRFGAAYRALEWASSRDAKRVSLITWLTRNLAIDFVFKSALQVRFTGKPSYSEQEASRLLALSLEPWTLTEILADCPDLKRLLQQTYKLDLD